MAGIPDNRHLEKHGNQWRVTIAVPRQLRSHFGTTHRKHPLRTPDLARANVLKGPHVARLKAEIAAARGQGALGRFSLLRDDTARQFAFEWGYQPKTIMAAVRSIRTLRERLGTGEPTAIDRQQAATYARHLVLTEGLARKNASRHLSFLRSFWAWLEDTGQVPLASSPWEVRLPRARPNRHANLEADKGKRPKAGDAYLFDPEALVVEQTGIRSGADVFLRALRVCGNGAQSLTLGRRYGEGDVAAHATNSHAKTPMKSKFGLF